MKRLMIFYPNSHREVIGIHLPSLIKQYDLSPWNLNTPINWMGEKPTKKYPNYICSLLDIDKLSYDDSSLYARMLLTTLANNFDIQVFAEIYIKEFDRSINMIKISV